MLIGLVGKKYSGKTTVASMWNNVRNSHILAFGDLLKEMLLNAGMASKEELWETKTPIVRWMLQKIGTEIFRDQVDPDFWIKQMDKKIIDILSKDKNNNIIIHDVRFLNEAELIKKYHGILIRIKRPTLIDDDVHRSEQEQNNIKCDCDIYNIGTLEELQRTVKSVIYQILINKSFSN